MRPSQLLAAVVAVSSVSASWNDVFGDVHALAGVDNMLYRRQDKSDSAKPSDPKTTDAPKETGDSSATPTPTGSKSDDSKTTDKPSGSSKPSDKESGSKGPSKTSSKKKPTPTEFGPDIPPGGIAMVTPGPFDGQQFYKIGDWVTLAWNYTSLEVTPSAVDVLATCTNNQATYTLALNQSVQETGQVFWDTANYNNDHPNGARLLTAMYTLMIYDSNTSVTDTPRNGYLAPYKQFSFGMYERQPYVNWTDFKCANCNGALSPFEALTLKALLFTSATTIASLLYFTASFGVW